MNAEQSQASPLVMVTTVFEVRKESLVQPGFGVYQHQRAGEIKSLPGEGQSD